MIIGCSQIYENWHCENQLKVFNKNIDTMTRCISELSPSHLKKCALH
jgi:hypothetical protein